MNGWSLRSRRTAVNGADWVSLDEEIEALYKVEEITSETIGLDFKRNQKIHRAWKIQHLGMS